ncbi:hypothetical protein HY641_00710 [Candidatus Woesearchaeota archaeon]|nr:hypothetical protein [Candidatus Woesearchaeota archaeon]
MKPLVLIVFLVLFAGYCVAQEESLSVQDKERIVSSAREGTADPKEFMRLSAQDRVRFLDEHEYAKPVHQKYLRAHANKAGVASFVKEKPELARRYLTEVQQGASRLTDPTDRAILAHYLNKRYGKELVDFSKASGVREGPGNDLVLFDEGGAPASTIHDSQGVLHGARKMVVDSRGHVSLIDDRGNGISLSGDVAIMRPPDGVFPSDVSRVGYKLGPGARLGVAARDKGGVAFLDAVTPGSQAWAVLDVQDGAQALVRPGSLQFEKGGGNLFSRTLNKETGLYADVYLTPQSVDSRPPMVAWGHKMLPYDGVWVASLENPKQAISGMSGSVSGFTLTAFEARNAPLKSVQDLGSGHVQFVDGKARQVITGWTPFGDVKASFPQGVNFIDADQARRYDMDPVTGYARRCSVCRLMQVAPLSGGPEGTATERLQRAREQLQASKKQRPQRLENVISYKQNTKLEFDIGFGGGDNQLLTDMSKDPRGSALMEAIVKGQQIDKIYSHKGQEIPIGITITQPIEVLYSSQGEQTTFQHKGESYQIPTPLAKRVIARLQGFAKD